MKNCQPLSTEHVLGNTEGFPPKLYYLILKETSKVGDIIFILERMK